MSDNVPSALETKTVVASAPGKILLAGGYLVLEPKNIGLVIAVDKRFYTKVKLFLQNDATDTTSTVKISVTSPQFRQTWTYVFDRHTLSLTSAINCPTDGEPESNIFVEKTLKIALLYLDVSLAIHEVQITIWADNEFYGGGSISESNICSVHDVSQSPRGHESSNMNDFQWQPAKRVNGRVTKTGLGSSACLVTSLVAALCYALMKDDGNVMQQQQAIITGLSQISHCYAQGKIGSGFDVSAACSGSHVYRRFPEAAIRNVLDLLTSTTGENAEGDAGNRDAGSNQTVQHCLRDCVHGQWQSDCIVEPLNFSSDSLLQVILADVAGGSESPGMARKVLQWKNSQTDPLLWTELAQVNDRIAKLCQSLLACRPTAEEREQFANVTADEWKGLQQDNDISCGSKLIALHQALSDSRKHLKAMGDQAGVPIEPDEQTLLADATMQLPGVVAALCPGAGGFDAVACVYIQDTENSVRRRIERFWSQWSNSAVGPLDVRAISYSGGVRRESADSLQI
ncbi:hypothetical protein MPSEU_000740700 [Mayamaea pseudoterrestris]|nr:hypothetical protein MPSEU_000740700 [Mayamaea pseudoterrestris]